MFGCKDSFKTLSRSEAIGIDGTFEIAPKLWKQVLIISSQVIEDVWVPESSRQSIGGNDLRQLRANLHFTSTFSSTLVAPSFTVPPPTPPQPLAPNLPQKILQDNAGMYVMNRLLQANMVLSSTQPETVADGNCFVYCILDQLMYDPIWRFVTFNPDTFRSAIVNSC